MSHITYITNHYINNIIIILNEYQFLRYAQLGRLTYEDGTPFEGYYHIHLGKPMEGQYHSTRPHKNLVFIEKDSIVKESPFTQQEYHSHGPHTATGNPEGEISVSSGPSYTPPEAVQEQVTQVVQQPYISTPSTPSTPSAPSSGGGGGY